jgi:hypothetical protein
MFLHYTSLISTIIKYKMYNNKVIIKNKIVISIFNLTLLLFRNKFEYFINIHIHILKDINIIYLYDNYYLYLFLFN